MVRGGPVLRGLHGQDERDLRRRQGPPGLLQDGNLRHERRPALEHVPEAEFHGAALLLLRLEQLRDVPRLGRRGCVQQGHLHRPDVLRRVHGRWAAAEGGRRRRAGGTAGERHDYRASGAPAGRSRHRCSCARREPADVLLPQRDRHDQVPRLPRGRGLVPEPRELRGAVQDAAGLVGRAVPQVDRREPAVQDGRVHGAAGRVPVRWRRVLQHRPGPEPADARLESILRELPGRRVVRGQRRGAGRVRRERHQAVLPRPQDPDRRAARHPAEPRHGRRHRRRGVGMQRRRPGGLPQRRLHRDAAAEDGAVQGDRGLGVFPAGGRCVVDNCLPVVFPRDSTLDTSSPCVLPPN
eukprot:SAG22_NODE_678_length_7959_cov_8.441985_2_plen_352_part_00